jgi:GxxExxY protein
MNTDEHRLNELSERIIGCAYKVANTLGYGFLEKVYENALGFEIRQAGLHVAQQQQPVTVKYEGRVVGEYVSDLLIEGLVLVELKCVTVLERSHIAQCLNYLKATDLRLCLLLNFGRARIEVRRVIL